MVLLLVRTYHTSLTLLQRCDHKVLVLHFVGPNIVVIQSPKNNYISFPFIFFLLLYSFIILLAFDWCREQTWRWIIIMFLEVALLFLLTKFTMAMFSIAVADSKQLFFEKQEKNSLVNFKSNFFENCFWSES